MGRSAWFTESAIPGGSWHSVYNTGSNGLVGDPARLELLSGARKLELLGLLQRVGDDCVGTGVGSARPLPVSRDEALRGCQTNGRTRLLLTLLQYTVLGFGLVVAPL